MEIFRKQEHEQNITVQCTIRQENVQNYIFWRICHLFADNFNCQVMRMNPIEETLERQNLHF
jgi:hypothetical protein